MRGEKIVLEILRKKKALDFGTLLQETKLSRTTLWRVLRVLENKGIIVKDDKRRIYMIFEEACKRDLINDLREYFKKEEYIEELESYLDYTTINCLLQSLEIVRKRINELEPITISLARGVLAESATLYLLNGIKAVLRSLNAVSFLAILLFYIYDRYVDVLYKSLKLSGVENRKEFQEILRVLKAFLENKLSVIRIVKKYGLIEKFDDMYLWLQKKKEMGILSQEKIQDVVNVLIVASSTLPKRIGRFARIINVLGPGLFISGERPLTEKELKLILEEISAQS
ncbi:MAG: hypothetical protein ACXQTI_03560 [Candidatus Nezhaarchaeales archaeon]